MSKTFEVLEHKISSLEAEFARLAKKARKFGLKAPELVITNESRLKEFEVEIPLNDEFFDLYGTKTVKKLLRVVKIEVVGETPVLNGWSLVGVLEHVEGEVILHSINDEPIPVKYRTANRACDHCQFVRNRNETFIVRNEKGEHRQIGRQCLKDFLGSSDFIYNLAAEAEMLIQSYVFASSCEGFEGAGGGGPIYAPLTYFVAASYAAAEKFGWMSRSKASEQCQVSTSDRVWNHIFPNPFSKLEKFTVSDENMAKAEEAIDFVLNKWTETTDFACNIQSIIRIGGVKAKHAGYAAAITIVYDRELQRKRENVNSTSEYVGEVGKRMEMDVRCDFRKVIDGNDWVPTKTIYKFSDSKGNVFTWFASGTVETFKVDESYRIKGTVKKHDIDKYSNKKTTYLSRVSSVAAKGTARA